ERICGDVITVQEYYDSTEKVRCVYKIINGKRKGLVEFFHKNGKIQETAFYDNDSFNGPNFIYNEKRKLIYSGYYLNNKPHGNCEEYYDNGRIKTVLQIYKGETFCFGDFNFKGEVISPFPFFKIENNNVIFYKRELLINPIVKFGKLVNGCEIFGEIDSLIVNKDTISFNKYKEGIFYSDYIVQSDFHNELDTSNICASVIIQ
ncbi:MAG: hypothetical protein AB1458_16375, partial [Bacteroidota bacterium]